MASKLYLVVDESEGQVVRSGFFGQILHTNKEDAKQVAREDDDYEVYGADPA